MPAAAVRCWTGTGPAVVRAPLLAARPLPPNKSDIEAFSSARSGVKVFGVRIASSSAYSIADAVRREMRRAGCGWAEALFAETARGRDSFAETAESSSLAEVLGRRVESKELDRPLLRWVSRFGVRRRL